MGNCIQRGNKIIVEAVDISVKDVLPRTPFEDFNGNYYWISLYSYSTKDIIKYQEEGYSIISKTDHKLSDRLWLRKSRFLKRTI